MVWLNDGRGRHGHRRAVLYSAVYAYLQLHPERREPLLVRKPYVFCKTLERVFYPLTRTTCPVLSTTEKQLGLVVVVFCYVANLKKTTVIWNVAGPIWAGWILLCTVGDCNTRVRTIITYTYLVGPHWLERVL